MRHIGKPTVLQRGLGEITEEHRSILEEQSERRSQEQHERWEKYRRQRQKKIGAIRESVESEEDSYPKPDESVLTYVNWRQDTWEEVWRLLLIIEEFRKHWPLTVRQVYYQAVAREIVANVPSEYTKISRLLTQARMNDILPWEAIEDRSRRHLQSKGWSDWEEFRDEEYRNLLRGYQRNLLQTQKVSLEIWVEKDAVANLCHRIALPYTVDVVVGRGFSSTSYKNDLRERVKISTEEGKQTIILYFGDFDPSGIVMLPSMMKTLREKMGLGEQIVGQTWALKESQIEEYNLPYSFDTIKVGRPDKKDDQNAATFIARYGTRAVELDALPPDVLQGLVMEAIESNIDMDLFNQEREIEEQERKTLEKLRKKIIKRTE